MDVKKVLQTENMITPQARSPQGVSSGGASFAETLGQIGGTKNSPMPGSLQGLQQGLNPVTATAAEPVKFSNHAIERMMSRGIQFNKDDMNRLNEAVQRAASKGSKDSLILMNDSALIVSVKNKTVVTVMDKNALKENVFTNIDSTIVM